MIKKPTLAIICLLFLCLLTINGQDTLKPFSNKWGTELNFNPFNGELSLNNTTGQIKLRKFNANNTALRIAFTLGFQQDNSKSENPYGTNPTDDQTLRKSLLVAVNIGHEKHLEGSRRLSPYVGFDIGAGLKLSSQSNRSEDGYIKIKGAWQEFFPDGSYGYYTITERAFWSVGANVVSGIDFYISKDFYFGYEIQFGLDYIHYSNIKFEDNATTDNNSYPDKNDESWKFGPKLINGIRIGYVF